MKLSSVLLATLCLSTAVLAKEKYAPLPDQVMRAKTVFIDNQTKDAQRTDEAYRELPKRFTIVSDRSKADLVFVLTMKEYEGIASSNTRVSNQIAGSGTTITTGGGVYTYTSGSVTLEIRDANGTVWANTKPFSRKGATRDLMRDLKDRIEHQDKK